MYSKSQAVAKADIVDKLTSTATTAPLSANMGKALNDELTALFNPSAIIAMGWYKVSGGIGGKSMAVLPYRDSLSLLGKYLQEALRDMEKNRVCFRFFGDLSRLSPELQKLCRDAEMRSEDYDVQVNFCLNYGGRDEIVHAANMAIADGHTTLTEEILSRYMYTAGSPDPDIVIRTGGDFRVSNFLLWQGAYSEFVVLDTLWPDFGDEEIMKAVRAFYKRKRRFGGLDKEDVY